MPQNPQHTPTRPQPLPSVPDNPYLNPSTSKMHYSIPKASRFPQSSLNNSPDKFYDIPETKSPRATSFGYGNKSELGREYFVKPPPGVYQVRGEFDIRDPRKGITISAGREIVKNNSVFEIKGDVPGPGQYAPKGDSIAETSRKKGYLIPSRSVDVSGKWAASVPGPGMYETLDLLDKNLKSSNSRFATIKSTKFSRKKRQPQFQSVIKQAIPGPGQYSTSEITSVTAKFALHNGHKFTHSPRKGIIEKSMQSIPGPCSYKYLSDFMV